MHVKTLRSQKLRMLLTHRKLLQSKAIGHSELQWQCQLMTQSGNSAMFESCRSEANYLVVELSLTRKW